MEGQKEVPQMNIDLKTTTPLKGEMGAVLFNQGLILRKVSKFLTGSNEDGIIPIPVFYEVETGKILSSTLPKEIRDEYKDFVMETNE